MSVEDHNKYFPPRPKRRIYPFYKVKDGDDCLKKTLMLSAYSGSVGATAAVIAAVSATTPENPALGSNVIIKLARVGLPMVAVGGMYAATTCAVSSLRGGKNDPFNHFWAGLATGSVFGAVFKSQKVGWGMGFALGAVAAVIKAGKMEGFLDIDETQFRREVTLGGHRRSYFTTRPDPEGAQKF